MVAVTAAQMRYREQSNCFLNDRRQERNAQHAAVEQMYKQHGL